MVMVSLSEKKYLFQCVMRKASDLLQTILIFSIIWSCAIHSTICGDAPVISPFIFPPALKEGEKASVTCYTRSGDKPIEFQWKKDDQVINGGSNVEIQSLKDSSIMAIEKVSSKNAGNYTCVVTNAYGKDQFTASLTVTSAPEWLNEPVDTLVEEGDSLSIKCQATGVPLPSIKWTSGESNLLLPGEQASTIRTSEGGALIISKVEASMEGSYTCEANNGYGEPLKKVILISVRGSTYHVEAGDAPVVASFAFPHALKEGESGTVICSIRSGDKPLQFQWIKDGEEIKKTQNVEIQSVRDTSILLIDSVTSQSSGNYTCIVKNAFGSDRYTANLAVSAQPTWIKEPNDVIYKEGESVSLECRAFGVPKPTITWTTVKLQNDFNY
ncbi:hypothetical protein JTE90_017447 [Oedothorax gibbosus]|uniref:Ig-like domain-containing protein n=1 Tax=Oedothorax gibbosus TaxID=931172 RepID=A0AAV6U2Q3_9ARAC|nr:hypothetical protein JTE90_017447 [Oedothorax gibbosus]